MHVELLPFFRSLYHPPTLLMVRCPLQQQRLYVACSQIKYCANLILTNHREFAAKDKNPSSSSFSLRPTNFSKHISLYLKFSIHRRRRRRSSFWCCCWGRFCMLRIKPLLAKVKEVERCWWWSRTYLTLCVLTVTSLTTTASSTAAAFSSAADLMRCWWWWWWYYKECNQIFLQFVPPYNHSNQTMKFKRIKSSARIPILYYYWHILPTHDPDQ